MQTTKKCVKCHIDKPLQEFSNQQRGKYGKKSYCKQCDRQYNQTNYYKNKKRRISQIKQWQKQNRDDYLKYQQQYHIKS